MKRDLLQRTAGLFFVLFFSSTTGSAQYAEDVLRFSQLGLAVGARSLAMGNVAVGLVDDYSALYWNPAGLAQARSYEFSAGLSFLGYSNNTRFLGTKTNATHNVINLNNLGLVYPVPTVRGSLTFALGFNRVSNYTTTASYSGFNSSSSIIPSLIPNIDLTSLPIADLQDLLDNNIPYQLFLADTANGRIVTPVTKDVEQRATIREGGGINHWSFGGAMDVARDFSLGVSLNIVSGTYSYDREYRETDVNNVYQKAPSDFLGLFDRFTLVSTINSDISGFNANFGLMYRKPGSLKIGFTVRTPTYYTISETYSDEGKSQFDPNSDGTVDVPQPILFEGKTEYKVITPLVLSLGGSVQFQDWLVLGVDAEYTDWTQMKFNTKSSALESENRFIRNIYQATINLRVGAEATLWDYGLKLRGGLFVNPSPYEGDPPEFDQHYYTAGFGYQLDANVWLNVAYAFSDWKTFRDNYSFSGTPPSRTSEIIKTHNLNTTLSFRF